MNKKSLDQQIKDHLLEKTEKSIYQKEETWSILEEKIIAQKNERQIKMPPWLVTASLVAIVFIVVISSSTGIVQGMFQNIKSFFVEEKEQEVEIEGTKEEEKVQLETNEEMQYIIYFDHERYKLEKGEVSDRIVPAQELEERYPEVSMEIRRETNTSTEDVLKKIKGEMDGLEVRAEEMVFEPIEAISIRAIEEGESNWDTPIYQWYITPTMDGQVFVIKQSYFLEAAEGHGARFYQILKSFKIVTK